MTGRERVWGSWITPSRVCCLCAIFFLRWNVSRGFVNPFKTQSCEAKPAEDATNFILRINGYSILFTLTSEFLLKRKFTILFHYLGYDIVNIEKDDSIHKNTNWFIRLKKRWFDFCMKSRNYMIIKHKCELEPLQRNRVEAQMTQSLQEIFLKLFFLDS